MSFIYRPVISIVSSQLGGPNKNRVELNNDHVLVYIPEVGRSHQGNRSGALEPLVVMVLLLCQQMKKDKVISHRVSLIREFQVTGQKPAVIKIYDYYEPSKPNHQYNVSVPLISCY